jgi:DNA-binding NarL/FixJ family response regulator
VKHQRRTDLFPGCDAEFHPPAAPAVTAHAAATRCRRNPSGRQLVRIGRLAQSDAHAHTGARLRATTSQQLGAMRLPALTRSEHTVARLVADGHSNREIADRLTVSHRTIESHMRAIYRKLAVTSRVQVARVVLGTHR